MSLTDVKLRNLKHKDKQYKVSDEKGLYILVKKPGKYFRYDYTFAGKRKTLSIGVYPDMPLKEARDHLSEAKRLLRDNIDPVEYKKNQKELLIYENQNSFEAVSLEWYTKRQKNLTSAPSKWRKLEKDIFPFIGSKPIKDISPQELLRVIRKIESRGAIETAHRTLSICGEVFKYGISCGKAERDISLDLKGSLEKVTHGTMAAILDEDKIGELLRVIGGYNGDYVTKCALALAPYVFVRPGELRQAEWNEINFEKKIWTIPAHKMKKRRIHITPLSTQAIEILQEIHPVTGRWKYVFPSVRSKDRPMSNNTVLAALRRMGYTTEEMTGHGFRKIASTLLNNNKIYHKNEWSADAIEMQLAHVESNKARKAYNEAEYLDERILMMQWYADYLDLLKDKAANVKL